MHELGHFADHAIETNVQPVNAESNARNATPHPPGRRARFKTSATATATSGTTVSPPQVVASKPPLSKAAPPTRRNGKSAGPSRRARP
jgi:hypothetical protein